jgi:hypothetical protein
LVDCDCEFYDSAPTTIPDPPTSVHVPPNKPTSSITLVRQFSWDATGLLFDLTEARPLNRVELNVKTPHGGQQISGLVYCAVTLDFELEDFVRRFSLSTRKSKVRTPCKLANGQNVTSSTVCDITFDLARHELQRTFYVLRYLRDVDMLGTRFITMARRLTRLFTDRHDACFHPDGGYNIGHLDKRVLECLLISFGKAHKLLRKRRESKRRNADSNVIYVSPAAKQLAEFHTREERSGKSFTTISTN